VLSDVVISDGGSRLPSSGSGACQLRAWTNGGLRPDSMWGFTEIVTRACQASSALSVAIGYCQGTPMRTGVEAHPRARSAEVTDVAAAAVAKQLEPEVISGKIRAPIVTAARNS
jgi:hypothetical protein